MGFENYAEHTLPVGSSFLSAFSEDGRFIEDAQREACEIMISGAWGSRRSAELPIFGIYLDS